MALRYVDAEEVIHGSRRRAVETAAIVGRRLGLVPNVSESAEDLTPIPSDWSMVPERYHKFLGNVPSSQQDVDGLKLNASFETLGEIGVADRTVIMVTHNFVIGWFIRRALDAPWSRWIGLNQGHASISTVQWSYGLEPRLLRSNERGYL